MSKPLCVNLGDCYSLIYGFDMVSSVKRFAINWICNITIPQSIRAKVLKWAGVKIKDPSSLFVGYGTILDTINPSGIVIDESVVITTGVTILSHYLDTKSDGLEFRLGVVHICKGVFIGANTTICNAVTIGENSIIGAGSVVTKDIPANEIWAGNPARFINKR